jgi:hypothetical protein
VAARVSSVLLVAVAASGAVASAVEDCMAAGAATGAEEASCATASAVCSGGADVIAGAGSATSASI